MFFLLLHLSSSSSRPADPFLLFVRVCVFLSFCNLCYANVGAHHSFLRELRNHLQKLTAAGVVPGFPEITLSQTRVGLNNTSNIASYKRPFSFSPCVDVSVSRWSSVGRWRTQAQTWHGKPDSQDPPDSSSPPVPLFVFLSPPTLSSLSGPPLPTRSLSTSHPCFISSPAAISLDIKKYTSAQQLWTIRRRRRSLGP